MICLVWSKSLSRRSKSGLKGVFLLWYATQCLEAHGLLSTNAISLYFTLANIQSLIHQAIRSWRIKRSHHVVGAGDGPDQFSYVGRMATDSRLMAPSLGKTGTDRYPHAGHNYI